MRTKPTLACIFMLILKFTVSAQNGPCGDPAINADLSTLIIDGCTGAIDGTVLVPGSGLQNAYRLCCEPYQAGSLWRRKKVNFSHGFLGPFIFRFGSDSDAGDGMAVMLTRDSFGFGNCPNAPGWGLDSVLSQVLKEYVVIQFKNYPNIPGQVTDSISLIIRDTSGYQRVQTESARSDGANIEDDSFHFATFLYNGWDNTLILMVDDEIRITDCFDFIDSTFNGDAFAYVGVLAVNGSEPSQQIVALRTSNYEASAVCCPTNKGCILGNSFGEGWYQLGRHEYGRWKILDQDVVRYDFNSPPSIFALPIDLLNVEIRFNMRVVNLGGSVGNDNDCIGMVWGLKAPGCGAPDDYDSYLFSWRKETQVTDNQWLGRKGYIVAKVDAHIPVGEDSLQTDYYFWSNPNDDPYFQVLLRDTAANGWDFGVNYAVALTYTSSKTVITINSDTIFSMDGQFDPGRFGFYTYSEAGAEFSGFSYHLLPAFVAESPDACKGAPLSFHYADPLGQGVSVSPEMARIRWDFGDGTPSPWLPADEMSFNPVHTYMVGDTVLNVKMHVENIYGCQDSAEIQAITVHNNPPLHLSVADTVLCPGQVLYQDLTIHHLAGLSYAWIAGQDTFPGPTRVISQPGFYQAEVSNGYCVAHDTLQVDYWPAMHLEVVQKNTCFEQKNGEIQVFISGGSAIWSTKLNDSLGTSLYFGGLTPGFYFLTVTDVNGCSFTNPAIQIQETPYPAVQKNIADASCFGATDGSLFLDATDESLRFRLGDGEFQAVPLFAGLPADFFVLEIEDTSGCVYPDTFEIKQPPERHVFILGDDLIHLGDSVQLSSMVLPNDGVHQELAWTGPGLSCSDCPAPVATPHQSALYQLLATDLAGCTASATHFITVGDCKVFVANIFSPNGDGQNDYLYVDAGSCVRQIKEFQIWDRWGELLFRATDFAPDALTGAWDGMRFSRVSFSPPVCVYRVIYEDINGMEITEYGNVTVIK